MSWNAAFQTRLHACPANTQISLHIHAVWSEPSQGAVHIQIDNEDSDHAQAYLRLHWVRMQSRRKWCAPAEIALVDDNFIVLRTGENKFHVRQLFSSKIIIRSDYVLPFRHSDGWYWFYTKYVISNHWEHFESFWLFYTKRFEYDKFKITFTEFQDIASQTRTAVMQFQRLDWMKPLQMQN